MAPPAQAVPAPSGLAPGVPRLSTCAAQAPPLRRLATLACAVLLLMVTSVAGAPREREWTWTPELAPTGPLVIVVSLPAQQAHVYRNGVRIGMSAVSTGKPGHDTPSGVYAILQKHREHYSNLYDNAPMPFMQRLTWD